jgi:hypothetical protein
VSAPALAVVRVEDAYLPLKALASYSGLSIRTLRGYLSSAAAPLPHYRIGGRVLVKRSEFDAWATRFRVVTVTATVDDMVSQVVAGLRR